MKVTFQLQQKAKNKKSESKKETPKLEMFCNAHISYLTVLGIPSTFNLKRARQRSNVFWKAGWYT